MTSVGGDREIGGEPVAGGLIGQALDHHQREGQRRHQDRRETCQFQAHGIGNAGGEQTAPHRLQHFLARQHPAGALDGGTFHAGDRLPVHLVQPGDIGKLRRLDDDGMAGRRRRAEHRAGLGADIAPEVADLDHPGIQPHLQIEGSGRRLRRRPAGEWRQLKQQDQHHPCGASTHGDQCSLVMVDSMSSLAEITRLFIS
jgi:hypothetical protein